MKKNEKPMRYDLGIDGGATKTAMKLCDGNGTSLAQWRGDACNPFDIGMEKAQEVLREGMKAVCRGICPQEVSLFAGLSGGITGGNREKFLQFFSQFGFGRYDCGSDNENLMQAAFGEGDGITLILGTGICAFSRQNGELTRTGGWGYLIDDGGSAYHYGRDAIHAHYAALDGTGQKTMLSTLIEKRDNGDDVTFLSRLYEGGKKYIASFAPDVFTAGEQGDAVAKEILVRNMKISATILNAAAGPFERNQTVPVVIAGGLTAQPRLIVYLNRALEDIGVDTGRFSIRILDVAPVDGAVSLANRLRLKG